MIISMLERSIGVNDLLLSSCAISLHHLWSAISIY